MTIIVSCHRGYVTYGSLRNLLLTSVICYSSNLKMSAAIILSKLPPFFSLDSPLKVKWLQCICKGWSLQDWRDSWRAGCGYNDGIKRGIDWKKTLHSDLTLSFCECWPVYLCEAIYNKIMGKFRMFFSVIWNTLFKHIDTNILFWKEFRQIKFNMVIWEKLLAP